MSEHGLIPTRLHGDRAALVYFEDLGTTIDISMEELPAFLDSSEHESAHSDDVRNFQVVENNGPTIVLTFERKFDGRWIPARTRVNSFPPYCRFIEELEGEFAGSRFAGIHRPDGSRTRVEIFGDLQSASMSGEKLRMYWLDVLAKSHDEDLDALRRFRDRPR